MAIPWEEKYSVGVKEIDDQHKHFISLLNGAYGAFYDLAEKERMEKLISDLIEYKDLHFSTEEKYFDKFNYEFSNEHKKEHKKLKGDANLLKKRFEVEGNKIIPDLIDFLENWLVFHLLEHDQKYAKCFRDNGLV